METVDPFGLSDILDGKVPLPWQTPRLRSLAQHMVQAAEASRCAIDRATGWNWRGMRDILWPVALDRAADNEPGWTEIAAACIAAVDLLAGRTPTGSTAWPLVIAENRWQGEPKGTLALGKTWSEILQRVGESLPGAQELEHAEVASAAFEELRSPQIHALLRGAPPARVYMMAGQPTTRAEPEGAADVRRILQRFCIDGADVVWAFDTVSEGRSGMAAMFLRAAAQGWRNEFIALGDVGITGALDPEGTLIPVADLAGKILRFFGVYPGGVCFIPVRQVGELEPLRPAKPPNDLVWRPQKPDPSRITSEQWSRVVPLESVTALLARLGIRWSATDPISCSLDAIRSASRTTIDWRGRPRPVEGLAELPLRQPLNADRSNRFERTSLADISSIINVDGRPPRWVITGRPGSGKSMVLRQLHRQLSEGDLRMRGPSLLVPARRMGGGLTLGKAIADDLSLDVMAIAGTVSAPGLTGAVWLLVDGLDEVPADERRRIVGLVEQWPGPSVIATRGLPEQLPTGAVLVVPDLSHFEATRVLESEGRPDVAPTNRHQSFRQERSGPTEMLQNELARTPLGLSILAMVWRDTPCSRQDLLRDAVLHLVRRAEAEGRLPPQTRRRFERVGMRLLGAAAWRMLGEGRAILRVEDLAFAERATGSGAEDGELLHAAVEQGGFVQPVGPGRWEFSHKSFAEFAAALYLASSGEQWHEAVRRLGEPAVDEVLLHLSTQLKSSDPLLKAILTPENRVLSGLCLATRFLLEVPPGSVPVEMLVAILEPRLRLWRWLPRQLIPGGIGDIEDVKAAITRHVDTLNSSVDRLLAACAPGVAGWARDPLQAQVRSDTLQYRSWNPEESQTQVGDGDDDGDDDNDDDGDELENTWDAAELGKWFGRTFSLQRDVAGLLAAEGGVEQLRRRGPGPWCVELVQHFEHPQIGKTAWDLWWMLRTDEQLLDEVSALHSGHERITQIIGAVVRRGTPSQRREALLRLALAPSGARHTGRAVVEGASELPSDELLELWRPAWRIGVIASGGWIDRRTGSTPLESEQLYASFIDEDEGPARWRALSALRALSEGRDRPTTYGRKKERLSLAIGLEKRLRGLLDDPEIAVRVEALSMLIEAEVRLPLSELYPLILIGGPLLRPLVLQAALAGHPKLSSRVVASVLAVDEPALPEREIHDAPPELPWEYSTRRRARDARESVTASLRDRLQTWSGAESIFSLADDPRLAPVLQSILERHYGGDASPNLVRRALRTGNTAARRWAVHQLGWRTQSIPRELVEPLALDPDAEIANEAQQWLGRWNETGMDIGTPLEDKWPDFSASEPRNTTDDECPADLDETDLRFPLFGSARKRGRTITVAAVTATTSFADAWTLLGVGAIETKAADEMDGYYSEDGPDFILELAQNAASHNREAVQEVLAHLRQLYAPEWRQELIDNLGHPSRGLFSMFLLSGEPRSRDLLRAVAANDAAARRVADLAMGTPLAPAVVDALIEAVASGTLSAVRDEHMIGSRYSEPESIRTLRQIGGSEGLMRLLTRVGVPDATLAAMNSLLDTESSKLGVIGEGPALALRRWVGERLAAGNDRTQLLRILALCGTEADATAWQQAVERSELPEQDVAAVATLVGRAGGADREKWLQSLAMTTDAPDVVNAVFAVLADRGSLCSARWMFERLNDPPPAIQHARARIEERDRRKRAAQEDARAAGRRDWYRVYDEEVEFLGRPDLNAWEHSAHVATLLYGDEELGYRLAWHLDDNGAAIHLCEEYGRLPCHALLVIGALAHDPGEHVIPRSITGAGDEVAGSGVPEHVGAVIDLIVKRTDPELVRRALLEALLRGYTLRREVSLGELDGFFNKLGGPKTRDKTRLLHALRDEPDHPIALSFLAHLGNAEADVLSIWREARVPWLPSSEST